MKTWSTRDYGVTAVAEKLWRVYAKHKDDWIPVGGPCTAIDADAEIQRLQEEGKLGHPHKVPV